MCFSQRMPTPSKTVHVPLRGYDAMLQLRELLKDGGADALPPEFRAIVAEELDAATEAFARGAVHAIGLRVALALALAHRRGGAR